MKDEVWQVVCRTFKAYRGVELNDAHRQQVEQGARFVEFEGGAFLINGCEVDCFVTDERRKRWATRRLLNEVLGGVVKEHGRATCSIHPDNRESLNFAKRLGFTEYERAEKLIRLELKSWKSLGQS